MDAIINAMNSTPVGIVMIESLVAGFIGGIVIFWVAKGVGFEEGTTQMQKHYEQMSVHKQESDTTEMPAPTEEVAAETAETVETVLATA